MSKARKIRIINENYPYTKAIIYCRVSSERQVNDGHGLDGQGVRCHQRAESQGLEVVKVFREEGVSGKLFDRPAMAELIGYLDNHAKDRFVIIFDDLKRFARDLEVHLKLKAELVTKRGAKLDCLNFNFENSPVGRAIENIMAATAQLEREQNAEQVINKMKARLEKGYWAFGRRKGYDMVKNPVHGMLSVPNKDGQILKEALEGFAAGIYIRKIDVCRFLLQKHFWKTQKAEKYIDKITDIMRDPFYAGHIEYSAWEVSRRKGHHQGIISLETFDLIQKRLRKVDLNQRIRLDTSPDFPLRGVIIHDECKGHLTSAWYPNGKGKKYRKYVCHTKGCPSYNKPFSADEMESKFAEVLKKGAVKKETDLILKKIFDQVWEDEVAKIKESEQNSEQQKRALEKRLSDLTDLMLAAKSPALKRNYEKQSVKAASEIETIEGKSTNGIDLTIPYQTALEKATMLLKMPYIAWKKLNVHEQHALFFFFFQEKLPYSIKEGYQTHQIPYAARLFEDFVTQNTQLVEMPGVKPGSKTNSLPNYSQD